MPEVSYYLMKAHKFVQQWCFFFHFSLFSCNFDDQLSPSFLQILCISWDTPSENRLLTGLWQLPNLPVPLTWSMRLNSSDMSSNFRWPQTLYSIMISFHSFVLSLLNISCFIDVYPLHGCNKASGVASCWFHLSLKHKTIFLIDDFKAVDTIGNYSK